MENEKKEKSPMIGEEQEEQDVLSRLDMVKTIIVSLIACVTIVIVSAIIFQPITETITEYKQLPVCSLNTLVVGQTYEVNGKILILNDVDDYGGDSFRLYFEASE